MKPIHTIYVCEEQDLPLAGQVAEVCQNTKGLPSSQVYVVRRPNNQLCTNYAYAAELGQPDKQGRDITNEAIAICRVPIKEQQEVRLLALTLLISSLGPVQIEISSELGNPLNGNRQECENRLYVPYLRELTPQLLQAALKALTSAFTDETSLAIMVECALGERLSVIVNAKSNLQSKIYEVLGWARMHGRLTELLQGAIDSNPGNPDLRDFVAFLRFVC